MRIASHLEVFGMQEIHDCLDFSTNDDDGKFGIFSVKFSSDGRELVAGTDYSDIYVYDLEANKVALKISAHSVCRKITFSSFGLSHIVSPLKLPSLFNY